MSSEPSGKGHGLEQSCSKKVVSAVSVSREWGLKVHRIFGPGANVIDELAVPATQVENGIVRFEKLLKEVIDQHLPDAVPVFALGVEAARIDLLQLMR
jgi:hypothetical protein